MGEEKKKISFGFSKVTKKNAILPVVSAKLDTDIQFIDCVEEHSIKIVGGDDSTKIKELVIPMKNENTLRDNLLATIKKRNQLMSNGETGDKSVSDSKQEQAVTPLTLDEMAEKEILEDLKKDISQSDERVVQTVPLMTEIGTSEKESTLEDYDNVPVNDFGLAMLRGMGWAPEKGIGKNEKLVKPPSPILRPKGMGLGADKVIKKENFVKSKEELVLKKDSYVKVTAGQHKYSYGKVEGFDEMLGRVIVKLTISNTVVSLSEFMVEVVNNEEYLKNSKVLNVSKFYEYKEKEGDLKSEIQIHSDKKEIKKLSEGKPQHLKKDNNDETSDSEDDLRKVHKMRANIEKKTSKSISKTINGRRKSSSLSDSNERSSRKKSSKRKHIVSRKHRSRSPSRSKHDKFKRKRRHKSRERKSSNK